MSIIRPAQSSDAPAIINRRTDAHHFYFRQGYVESPKYLIKKLRD